MAPALSFYITVTQAKAETFSESAFQGALLVLRGVTEPHHPQFFVIKTKFLITHGAEKRESSGLLSCLGVRTARPCSGSWFPLHRAGHRTKSSRRSVCAKAGQSLRRGQVRLLRTSAADARAGGVLCFLFCESPGRPLSAVWLCAGGTAREVRVRVSSASRSLWWELEVLAGALSALTPRWMRALSRALDSPQHNETGVPELTGTAGIQRVEEGWLALK